MTASIIEHFSLLKDPRIERNKKHELIDIIVLSFCAVCSGANGWEAIEEFGHEKTGLAEAIRSFDKWCAFS